MNELITAFLPCRRDSERTKQKNIRQFADEEKGLIGIKMEQLLHCREIDQIVVSTDDQLVVEICQYMSREHRKPVRIVE